MKKSLLLIIVVIAILAILIIIALIWNNYKKEKGGLIINTYKVEYAKGENPKIGIENNSNEKICFSSCYPYYLEDADNGFRRYKYIDCKEENIAEVCIEPDKEKAFELVLDNTETEEGIHRIAVPACIGCAINDNFRQDKLFYSNEFLIK